jgi:hypothetical protein
MNERKSSGRDASASSIRPSKSSTVYSLAVGRGSRPVRRWKNDRQRKKKARERRTAAQQTTKK